MMLKDDRVDPSWDDNFAIKIASEMIPKGTKNAKAIALEAICAYFIENKGVKEDEEVF